MPDADRRAGGRPHTARLSYGRRELFADEDVWQELARWGASAALVRFSGGGGHPGSVAAVTLEDAGKKELARWGNGEGELPEALAAPIWGRYALFRGHPRITGLVMWDAQERRGGGRGRAWRPEVRRGVVRPEARPAGRHARAADHCARHVAGTPPRRADQTRIAPTDRRSASTLALVRAIAATPTPDGLRPEAKFCSKRCRQAASRERLKRQPPKPPSPPPERCSWCGGPMPAGLRAEARFCSKRCRQASSRHALSARRCTEPRAGRHVACPDGSRRERAARLMKLVGCAGGRSGALRYQGPDGHLWRGHRDQGRDRVLPAAVPRDRVAARERARGRRPLAQSWTPRRGRQQRSPIPREQLSLPRVHT